MYKREWTPRENNDFASASKITIYDAGAFVYELLEIEEQSPRLFCWEIQDREQGPGGKVIENLKSVLGEWIPFDLLNSESYSVKLIDSGYEIPGWTITNINQEPLELVRPKSQKALQAQEVVAQPSSYHPRQQGPPSLRKRNKRKGSSTQPSQPPSQLDQNVPRQPSSRYQGLLEAFLVPHAPQSARTALGQDVTSTKSQQPLQQASSSPRKRGPQPKKPSSQPPSQS